LQRPYIFRLEENKAIIRRLYEAQNKRDLALLDEFVASGLLERGHKLKGLEEYKKFVTMVEKGFPDSERTSSSGWLQRTSIPGFPQILLTGPG